VIHVDIDPAEIGKVRVPDVGVAGDCRLVIEELLRPSRRWASAMTAARPSRPGPGAVVAGRSLEWQERFPLYYDTGRDEAAIKPQMVVEQCATPPVDTIVVPGWASTRCGPRSTGGSSTPTPGSTPVAPAPWASPCPPPSGPRSAARTSTVWAIDGDGCFQMTAQELVTASAEQIPVKIAIFNNAYLGMVRQWQEMFYEERYSEVYLSPDLPDYVKWAEAMGCVGIRAETPEDVAPAIEKANSIDDRPVVVDFRTDAFEKVFPMVAGRRVQRRHRRAPRPAGPPMTPAHARVPLVEPATGHVRHHILSVLVENKAGCWPGWPGCSAAAASTSTRGRGADRRGRALQPHHHRRRRGVGALSSRSSCSSTS
jgi:acetolactate synthase-1/2/3 large subunit